MSLSQASMPTCPPGAPVLRLQLANDWKSSSLASSVRRLRRVNKLQLQAIGVCKKHSVVAVAIVGIICRRIENGGSHLGGAASNLTGLGPVPVVIRSRC